MKITIKQAKMAALQAKQSLLKNLTTDKADKYYLKEIIELIDDFLKCHCSNDAIFMKYNRVKARLSELKYD